MKVKHNLSEVKLNTFALFPAYSSSVLRNALETPGGKSLAQAFFDQSLLIHISPPLARCPAFFKWSNANLKRVFLRCCHGKALINSLGHETQIIMVNFLMTLVLMQQRKRVGCAQIWLCIAITWGSNCLFRTLMHMWTHPHAAGKKATTSFPLPTLCLVPRVGISCTCARRSSCAFSFESVIYVASV